MKLCPRCGARFSGDITACPIDGTLLREPADPFIGRTIAGRYLIQEELGSGGMGTVYRARHQIIGRDVALKFLEPSLIKNERQRKRFLGEARAANQINHEHIIDITDFGETEDGLVYMVMEYLEGRTLAEDIDKGPMIPRRALRIATQVALGLARAHELGVVHRDIKPANIYLVRRKMDTDYVKILDFGVARIEHDVRITGQGTIVGTPEYIAPEQIRSATASPSADMYALGCVLFEMLTGRLPFEGKTTMLLVKHLNDPPPTPSSIVAAIPPEVDALVLRLLRKNPAERFRDAYHLVEELQGLLDRLPPMTRPAPAEGSSPNLFGVHTTGEPPDEEDTVYHTVALYSTLLAEAHPKGDPPAWLPEAIRFLEGSIGEVRALRQRLHNAAEKATEQEEQLRKPRTMIGRALDELAQDDSKLNRYIEGLETALRAAETQLDDAMQAVTQATQQLPAAWAQGYVLRHEDAQQLAQAREAGSELDTARERARELRAELDQKRIERKDLRFQIAELKDQLVTMNAASTIDQQVAHDEVNRVGTQIQAKLDAMAPYAARVAAHFEQFPQLRERLSARPLPTTSTELHHA
ncbi:MAG TPA: protein kinase [Polyangiales bacterium]